VNDYHKLEAQLAKSSSFGDTSKWPLGWWSGLRAGLPVCVRNFVFHESV
jgi:hypothetical protein